MANYKKITALLFIPFLWIMPANASQTDLSKIKCESEKVIEIIKEGMRSMRFSDGKRVSSEFDLKLVGKPKTKSASKNTLICGATIKVSRGGDSQRMRANLIFKQFSNGKINYSIKFGY